MMKALVRRLHREEQGYSLVIAMLLLSIMMVMLVVSLEAGNASLRQSGLSIEWSKTLTVAEAGVNDAVTRLGVSRAATNPCRIGLATVCSGGGGQYQVSWSQSGSTVLITSIGYYPTKASPQFAREVQVTYQPVPSFKYAIFSQTSLTVHNGMTVIGDVYSDGDITVGNNAAVCGSLTSSGGGITLTQSSDIVKSDAAYGCSGKSGNVWTGGTGGIAGANQVTVEGNLIAGNPSTATCSNVSTNYAIAGGSMAVDGIANACGSITSVSASSTTAGVAQSPPVPVGFPAFTFDPANYSSDVADPLHLQCYPSSGTCGVNDSATAASDFQAYVNLHKTNLTGTFAVWDRTPSQTHKISLDGITLGGDFTLITNTPVDFGNTNTVTTTSSSVAADLVVVSSYMPTASCTAALVNTGGSDCSIYGKNAVEFDAGNAADPDDGVVGLLFTTGKMAFVNSSQNFDSTGDGALYAQSMDFKNGFNIIYNSRVERVLGFGATLEQVLWQELTV
jgi:hypothetical protein